MATHSSFLACEILWTEESGGLQAMGSRESDMTERLNGSHDKAAKAAKPAPYPSAHTRPYPHQAQLLPPYSQD